MGTPAISWTEEDFVSDFKRAASSVVVSNERAWAGAYPTGFGAGAGAGG